MKAKEITRLVRKELGNFHLFELDRSWGRVKMRMCHSINGRNCIEVPYPDPLEIGGCFITYVKHHKNLVSLEVTCCEKNRYSFIELNLTLPNTRLEMHVVKGGTKLIKIEGYCERNITCVWMHDLHGISHNFCKDISCDEVGEIVSTTIDELLVSMGQYLDGKFTEFLSEIKRMFADKKKLKLVLSRSIGLVGLHKLYP